MYDADFINMDILLFSFPHLYRIGRLSSPISIHFRSLRPYSSSTNNSDDLHGLRGHGQHDPQRPKTVINGTIQSDGVGIKIGQFAELHRSFSQDDINVFGTLVGDFNPVHFPAAAQQSNIDELGSERQDIKINAQTSSKDTRPIVHGILVSSLFSSIFGTLIPGCIYRSQSLKFYHPVYVNELVCGRVLATKLRQTDRTSEVGGILCTCETTITKAKTNVEIFDESFDEHVVVCVTGEAQVWLPGVALLKTNND